MTKEQKIDKNAPLNDDSLMPWGKFKGDKMMYVPRRYLKWIYSDLKDMRVKAYIEEYLNYSDK